MSSKRIHRWILTLITKLYPRLYFQRHDPIVRPPRKPIRLDFDLLDRRESPTNLSPVGPGAAWLAPFLGAAQPLPALVQTSRAFEFSHPFSTSDAGEPVNLARIVGRSAARAEETSSLLPWTRIAGYGMAGDGSTTRPTSMPWHFAAIAFATSSPPILSAQDLIQDPLGMDLLPPSRSHGPQSSSFDPANRLRLGEDGASSGGNSGTSMPSSSNATDFSFSAANNLEPSSPLFPTGTDLTPQPPSLQGKGEKSSSPPLLTGKPTQVAGGLGEGPGERLFSNPTPPNAPRPAGPDHQGPHHHKDAFYVLDANKAIVVTPGTTDNEFSNTAMDLRMQVSAATVSSYSWDYSGAPDVTGVSGASTYNLTFSWTSFTGAARSETIIAKETPQGGSQLTQTLTFLVAGTNSPAWSTIPTSYSTWPSVLTPDTLSTMQAVQCCGSYGFLGLTAGDLQLGHSLPTYNPGVPRFGLVYNSIAANTLPMFITHFQIDPTQAVPPTVKAQLTLNSVAGSWVWYDTSHLNPGDIMQIPLQGDATGLSTGRYSWSISVTANYGTPVTTTYSGNVDIVNSSGGPFGAGWSLNVLQRIWPVSGSGAILELPGGLSLWFANGQQSGSFVTPPGDTSTLVLANNVYTRTLKDGTKINFNSNGYQTSIVDTNNNTLTFGYNGSNQLTTLTDFNNLVTTLAYNASNKLSTITDPASRVTTLAYDANNVKLTSITDPDSALWQYSYDSANRLTTLTDPDSHTTTYAYSTGRVTTVTRADSSTLLLTALELQGIPVSGTGTQSNPATPVLAAGATAAYTDARNNVWNTRMDWLGFGEPMQSADPLGDLASTYRDANGFPYVMADTLARRTRYFFDSLENPTKTVFADDNYEQRTFNGFSEVTKYTDPLSNVTTYGYDSNGNLTQIIDALSHTTTMTDTTHGFLASFTDPNSHTTTYGYDSRSRLTSITDALSHTATMAYDSASDVTGRTDFNGNATTYTYDAEGRLLTITLPGNQTSTTTKTYDAAGNLTTFTDPLGHTTTLAYDNLNRLTTTTDPLSHTTTYSYDNAGDLISLIDPLSHTTTYTYDTANRLIAVTDSLSHTTSYGYDAASERTTVTDPLSHTITYTYNVRGWLSTTTDPLGNIVTNSYDAAGDLTSTSKGTETYTSTFDPLRRPTVTTDPMGFQTTYAYDAVGNLLTITGPGTGNVVTYAYDAGNRLISITDQLSHTVTNGYDNNGNRTTVIDALSRTTTYVYDQQNRLTTVTGPLTGVMTYTYDAASRLTSITDVVNNTTTYSYDNANRLTTVTDPLGHNTTYGYDNANRLTSVTDRNARQITYSYDAAGNKTGETWVGGSYTATYTYDAANRLTVEQDTFSKYTVGYDNANRPTSVDNNGTPNAPRVVLTYTLDQYGNRTGLSDNLNGSIGYNYDQDNRLWLLNVSVQGQTAFPRVTLTYDARSRLTNISRGQTTMTGATISTTITYDNASRVTGINHYSSSAGTLAVLTYGYDAANQLTTYNGPEGTLTYTYDNDGQLTNVGGARTETYTYDKEGNRTMSGYTTGAGNRLTADGTYTYAYDNDGNMVGRTRTADGQVTAYTYDYGNRLTEVLIKTSTGITVQDDKFTYDVENRRIGKNTLSGGQSWTIYDGQNAYADFNSSGSLTMRYLQGPALDSLLARVDTSGNPIWYLTDNIGSVRMLVDTNGNIKDQLTYDSFGNILNETNSSNGDRFKFTGREWDSEIGQYYYRARYYNPTIGRFVSEDPLNVLSGDTNFYRYVRNSPLAKRDPSGQFPFVVVGVFVIGGAIIGVAGQAISDYMTGTPFQWQNYAGAAVGGAVSGGVMLIPGAGPVAAGAIGGGVTNLTQQGLNIAFGNQQSFDWGSFAWSIGAGAAFGALPGLLFPGLSVGGAATGRAPYLPTYTPASWAKLYSVMMTRIFNGTISDVSWLTAWKMFAGISSQNGWWPWAWAPGVVHQILPPRFSPDPDAAALMSMKLQRRNALSKPPAEVLLQKAETARTVSFWMIFRLMAHIIENAPAVAQCPTCGPGEGGITPFNPYT